MHNGGFALVYNEAVVYNVPTVQALTTRHAALRVLLYAVAYALTIDGAFILGKHFKHAEVQNFS